MLRESEVSGTPQRFEAITSALGCRVSRLRGRRKLQV
jgi:hypothetical protein